MIMLSPQKAAAPKTAECAWEQASCVDPPQLLTLPSERVGSGATRHPGFSSHAASDDAADILLAGHPALLRLQLGLRANDPLRLTMRHAAAIACLEPHYFSALFRRYIGMSFVEWRRRLRTRQAVKLIVGGTLAIDRIVDTVGYRDRRSLERAVKSLLGTTPNALRQIRDKT